jgi:hypothetical protein
VVYHLNVFNNQLIAGGDFGNSGNQSLPYIAAWNGSQWSALGNGLSGFVGGMHVFNGELWVTGGCQTGGTGTLNYVARLDGNGQWQQIDGGFNSLGWSLKEFQNSLYAGGFFATAGSSASKFVTRLNTSSGTNEFSSGVPTVYPNPCFGKLIIGNAGNAPENWKFLAPDMRLLLEGQSRDVNLESYPPGIYFLNFPGKNILQKVVLINGQ